MIHLIKKDLSEKALARIDEEEKANNDSFHQFYEKKRKRNEALTKKFVLNRSGYYWVMFKGDLGDKRFALAYFELEGSMGQTDHTFKYADREVGLEHVEKVHSYVERPSPTSVGTHEVRLNLNDRMIGTILQSLKEMENQFKGAAYDVIVTGGSERKKTYYTNRARWVRTIRELISLQRR